MKKSKKFKAVKAWAIVDEGCITTGSKHFHIYSEKGIAVRRCFIHEKVIPVIIKEVEK